MTVLTQAAFARHIGSGKSWVTQLKTAGKLVMTADGKVEVEQSLERMAGSTGAPGRAKVVTQRYADSKERREHIEAELKQMDLDERTGKLMQTSEVLSAVADAATTFRTRMESFSDVLSPQLAAISDEQQVRAILAEQVELVLHELVGRFALIGKAGSV